MRNMNNEPQPHHQQRAESLLEGNLNHFMSENYIIIWIAKGRNSFGIGKRYMTKEQAEGLTSELNNEHPDFLHRAVDTQTEPPETALRELRESLSGVPVNSVGVPGPAAIEAAHVEPDPWEEDVLPEIPQEMFATAF